MPPKRNSWLCPWVLWATKIAAKSSTLKKRLKNTAVQNTAATDDDANDDDADDDEDTILAARFVETELYSACENYQ